MNDFLFHDICNNSIIKQNFQPLMSPNEEAGDLRCCAIYEVWSLIESCIKSADNTLIIILKYDLLELIQFIAYAHAALVDKYYFSDFI